MYITGIILAVSKKIGWRKANMITNLFLFGKPSECRYHSLRSDRGKHRKAQVLMCMCWLLGTSGDQKKKGKKKTNGRYVFEIHAHKAGFITQRNGWACPGKVYRSFFGGREPRAKFRRTLKMERGKKKSIKKINKKQPKR